jgi:thiosulfate/3-mercaptopyruvate sulfurtransferase
MRRVTLALLATLALAGRALAQEPDLGDAKVTHDRSIVASTAWLAGHLDSSGVSVVHVGRSDSAFRAGHIPGAHFLPLAAVAPALNGVPNEFPAPDRIVAAFRELGVGDQGRVVLYGDDAGLLAARAWVALDLLGQGGRAAILDGGLTAWRTEGRSLETDVRPVQAAPFTATWHADRVVSAEWVRSHLGDSTVQLIDARNPDLFAGFEPASSATPLERRGHIPGAANIWWMNNLVSAANPVLRPMHYLHEELWVPSGTDREPVRTVVVYCHSGMQASFDYLAARYIGYHDVRIYDGSLAEWTALPAAQYPVANGAR